MTTLSVRCLWENVPESVRQMGFPEGDSVDDVLKAVAEQAKVPIDELGILRDPLLVLTCLASESGEKIVREHPCLIPALEHLMNSLHAEASRLAPEINAAMFDEERQEGDSDESDVDAVVLQPRARPRPQALQRPPQGPGRSLTPQQLASALALAATAAQGVQPANQAGPAAPSPNNNAPTPSSSTPISQNLLQAALMGAVGGATARPTQQQKTYPETLAQLQAMGFTNEAENLEAVRVANGDVETALAYIVDKRERDDMNLD